MIELLWEGLLIVLIWVGLLVVSLKEGLFTVLLWEELLIVSFGGTNDSNTLGRIIGYFPLGRASDSITLEELFKVSARVGLLNVLL